MMALQILLLLQVIVILCHSSHAYPAVYGTKRYGRSSANVHRNQPLLPSSSSSWYPSSNHPTMVRTQRYPVNYYEMYPAYSQGYYPDDYYYPPTRDDYSSSYPSYYPRTSKYEVYQAVMPYYYATGGAETARPRYYNDDLQQDEMIQEAERQEREEAQPIGHELLYENEDMAGSDMDEAVGANLDDVNAAFLQNLIMAQMYKDTMSKQKEYYDQYGDYEDSYGKWEGSPSADEQKFHQEDEDVRELKQLAKPKPKVKLSDVHWFRDQKQKVAQQKMQQQRNNNGQQKRDVVDNKLTTFTDRKPVVKVTSGSGSSTEAPTVEPRKNRGQKEEVLMRPASPVRHPFSGQVLEMMSKNEVDHKRSPSVYDTIKHMLDMEKSLENKYGEGEIRPHMKKRDLISSEENLIQQLSVLKKSPQ